jgi:hypothetical protein
MLTHGSTPSSSSRGILDRLLRAVPALVLLCSGASAFQSVHVVTNGSGTALQSAIDAAASGDTVLVHGGSYAACTIASKALTLVAEPSLSMTVAGLRVANTTAGQRVVVAGVRVVAPAVTAVTASPDCIVLDQCAGSVRLESMQASLTTPNGNPALRVSGSSDVALIDCNLTGSDGVASTLSPFTALFAGAGVTATNSRVAAYGCTLTGGSGNDGFTQDPCGNPFVWSGTAGAPGVALDATSTLFAQGGTSRGGDGGAGFNARCSCFTAQLIPGSNGSPGGAGVDNPTGASAHVLGTALVGGIGGPGGLPANCSGTPAGGGSPGASGSASTNPVNTLASTPLRFDAPLLVRAGQMLTLTLHGTVGDVAFLGRSFEARWLSSLPANGVLLIGPSGRRVPVGVFPPSGTLTINVPADILVPGAQSSIWHLQCFSRDPLGVLRIGEPAVVAVLDPAF